MMDKYILKEILIKYIFLLIILLLFLSCDDEAPIENNTPFLISLSKNDTYIGEEITIFGKNLGYRPDGGYVLFGKINNDEPDTSESNPQ